MFIFFCLILFFATIALEWKSNANGILTLNAKGLIWTLLFVLQYKYIYFGDRNGTMFKSTLNIIYFRSENDYNLMIINNLYIRKRKKYWKLSNDLHNTDVKESFLQTDKPSSFVMVSLCLRELIRKMKSFLHVLSSLPLIQCKWTPIPIYLFLLIQYSGKEFWNKNNLFYFVK